MATFRENNEKYRNQFISLREAFQTIHAESPNDSDVEIAEQLLRTFITDPLYVVQTHSFPYATQVQLSEDKRIVRISSENSTILCDLLKSISKQIIKPKELEEPTKKSTILHSKEELDYEFFADKIGWYRENFFSALSEDGIEFDSFQSQKIEDIDYKTQIKDLQKTIKELEKHINTIEEKKQSVKQELEELKTLQNSEIKFIHSTRLLKIAAITQAKYYADARKKSDVAKLSTILHELNKSYSLNEVEARAVERIVRTIER